MFAPVILGWETEVEINIGATIDANNNVIGGVWTLWGARGGRIADTSDLQECGDSSTGQYKSEKPGRYQASVTLDFYEKHNVNNSSTGFNLYKGAEIAMKIYPNGINAPGQQGLVTGPGVETQKTPWIFFSFIVGEYTPSWNVDGKLEGSFNGKSNNFYQPPTN
jgi:hypothetical protein